MNRIGRRAEQMIDEQRESALMSRKIRVFLSMVSEEFGAFREEIGNWLRCGGVDVEMQSSFPQIPVDSISCLEQKICDPRLGNCDLLIHVVGNQIGSTPKKAELARFLARYQQKPFLSKYPSLALELGEFERVSYTQFEAYLALELDVRSLVYAPANRGSAFVQASHLERIESATGRPSRKFRDANELWKCVFSDVMYFMSTELGPASTTIPLLLGAPGADAFRDEMETLLDRLREFSQPLLRWPTTVPNAGWLERAEMETLKGKIDSQSHSVCFVVGQPGSGKSALLSHLAHWSTEGSNCATLAIKADFLDDQIKTMKDLGRAILSSDADLITTLRDLSTARKLVVIVDQLDALANLADLRSGRLNVVLDLINKLAQLQTVHIVASVRSFELDADQRLQQAIEGGQRIDLGGLSHNQVFEALSKNNLRAEKWPMEYIDFLRIPYHLSLFLKHCQTIDFQGDAPPEAHLFSSIHAVHDQRWSSLLSSRTDRQEIEDELFRLAISISESESLWQPLESIGKLKENQVAALVDAGWLCIEDERVGFAHQTQYEVMLAKKYADVPDAFFNYVWQRRNGLFVRPAVWNVLSYIRNQNRPAYIRLMGRLIALIERRHLQRLFLEFLAQVPDPEASEVRWIKSFLENDSTYATTAWLIRGQGAWFRALDESFLGKLMHWSMHEAWPIARILEKAWGLNRDKVKTLLRTNWAFRGAYVNQLMSVLHENHEFDRELIAWCYHAMQQSTANTWLIERVLDRVSTNVPLAAPRLLAVVLSRQLKSTLANATATPRSREDFQSDEDFHVDTLVSAGDQGREFEKLFNCTGFFKIEKLAARAPVEFCRYIWPWFVRVASLCEADENLWMRSYRREWGNRDWFRERHHSGSELLLAMQASLKSWAIAAPFEYLQFFLEHQEVDSLVCHRLFSAALATIADVVPEFTWNYYLTDDRRFLLGSDSDLTQETRMLLCASIPYWERMQVEAIQRKILAWQPYKDEKDEESNRWEYYDTHNNSLRFRLLSQIPKTLRLEEANSLIARYLSRRSEERMEQGEAKQPELVTVRAPIVADDMIALSDEEIVEAIRELPDSTGRDHPTNWRYGGSEMLAEEFRTFAETHPEQAMAIMRLLEPGEHENVVGGGLRGIKKCKTHHGEALELIDYLVRSGFSKQTFRDDAGQCLREIAIEGSGLPNHICDMLESWLMEFQPSASDSTEDGSEDRRTPNDEAPQPILWIYQSGFAIPNNWFWIGEALKLGHCLAEPPREERWYQSLHRLVEIDFPSNVWKTWLYFYCHYVPSRAAVAPSLTKLLKRRSDLLRSDAGYFTLANFFPSIEEQDRIRLMNSLAESSNPRDRQVAGEIATCCGLICQDNWSSNYVQSILDNQDTQNSSSLTGIAFAAAQLWRDVQHRDIALSLFSKMPSQHSDTVTAALLSIFYSDHCLDDSEQSKTLLRYVADHLQFHRSREIWPLSRKLKDHLLIDPANTLAVCRSIVERAKSLKQQDAWASLSLSEESLISIALTLHRNTDQRIRAESLTLFEDLMDLQVHGVFEKLKQLDQRMSC